MVLSTRYDMPRIAFNAFLCLPFSTECYGLGLSLTPRTDKVRAVACSITLPDLDGVW